MIKDGLTRDRAGGVYEKGYEVYDQIEQLRVLVMTWNLGREKILVKPETMFPNSANADIIVAGF